MAPIRRRSSILSHLDVDNFDYFRSLTTQAKRKKSFKDTLRRKAKFTFDLRHQEKKTKRLENEDKANEDEDKTNLWRTFQTKNNEEFDLEQKIDLEIKMREGTTKLLAACHHPTQSLEAAKSLLTSNERMTVYLGELQKRKKESGSEGNNDCVSDQSPDVCKAKVCVSDIRMPLIWKEVDHFKNKGDYRRFAVFCLLRIGTEVYDTVMINRVDRSMTDISFDDVLVFNHVPHDFEFRLEVYSHILQDDLSIASTPRKIRHRINDSLSRTVGRKLAASVKDELNAAAEIGPKFELVAHSTLGLDDVDDNISTHDLQLENNENMHSQLPLFGHFCCRLAARPEFLTNDKESSLSGNLTLSSSSDDSLSRQMWAVLRANEISFWPSSVQMETDNCIEPEVNILINKDTTLKRDDSEHSIDIVNVSDDGRTSRHRVTAADRDEIDSWMRELMTTAQSHAVWKHAANTVMEIHSPVVKRLPLFSMTRKTSLYDQTAINKDSPLTIHEHRNGLRREGESSSSSTTSCSSSPPSTLPPTMPRSRSSSLGSCSIGSSSGTSSYTKRSTLQRQTQVKHRLSCHETTV